MEQSIVCGLIKGRHAVPGHVREYVFEGDIPQARVSDPAYMEAVCSRFLDRHAPSVVEVYVTGFTPALLALICVCHKRGIGVVAYNYDREGREFWRQEVI